MRISDWSSDVCSSDLFIVLAGGGSVTARGTVFDVILGKDKRVTVRLLRGAVDVERPQGVKGDRGAGAVARLEPGEVLSFAAIAPAVLPGIRSEELTSELQSLMRISYAVFCLKKKTNQTTIVQPIYNTY